MSVAPGWGIVFVLILLAAVLGLLMLLDRGLSLHAEVRRKGVHVGMGLVTLSFPWLFTTHWPVAFLAMSAVVALSILRSQQRAQSLGQLLHAVSRTSFGEIYFPIAVYLVFLGSNGQRVLFLVPILILTLADAAAALVGVRYGQTSYRVTDGKKSAEGSLTFLTLAFFLTIIPLLLMTDLSHEHIVLIAFMLALLLTLLEAVAWRGLDNIFVPLGALALLQFYFQLSTPALLVRLIVLLVLALFVFGWRRRTTLQGGALLAAALMAYAFWALGDVRWVAAPVLFFLSYTAFWPRRRDDTTEHEIDAVLTVTGVGFAWLVGSVLLRRDDLIVPCYASFAAHLTAVGVAWYRDRFATVPALQVASIAAGKSWLLLGGALMLLLPQARGQVAIIMGVSCILAVLLYHVLIPDWRTRPMIRFPWRRQAGIAVVVSAVSFLLEQA